MNASRFGELVRDLRLASVPYEPDLSWPFLVRNRDALYVALGRLCERGEERTELARRVMAALDWIRGMGLRSRWAEWFRR